MIIKTVNTFVDVFYMEWKYCCTNFKLQYTVIHFWVSCLQTNTKKEKCIFLGGQYVYLKGFYRLHSRETVKREEQFMDTEDAISGTSPVPPLSNNGLVTPATTEVPTN